MAQSGSLASQGSQAGFSLSVLGSIKSIEALKNMPLEYLILPGHNEISDLSPLKGKKLSPLVLPKKGKLPQLSLAIVEGLKA
jgi:hypothetical protein